MKKLLIAFVLLLGVVVISASMLSRSEPTNTTEPVINDDSTFPVSPPRTDSEDRPADDTSETLSLRSPSGARITVQNFMRNEDVVPDRANEGNYYLGNHYPVTDTEPYTPVSYMVTYTASTDFFNVTLLKEPLDDARLEAEWYLMDTLGLSREQLCDLSYTVSVPRTVNEYYAGASLGFSSCPDSMSI